MNSPRSATYNAVIIQTDKFTQAEMCNDASLSVCWRMCCYCKERSEVDTLDQRFLCRHYTLVKDKNNKDEMVQWKIYPRMNIQIKNWQTRLDIKTS